ncbi:MAG: ribonuclease Z [Flavobacteriaceae bacterium TMED120]|nr:MAG: ribonuclease Z [Flavobacteriaceae bacterium TMED120]CAI8265132.1 MAG: Ribonuclease BN [Flavobacteriaceae bacterium]HCQ23693.1 ribonuclease Z [Flavobacteriaceae bacterium]|tara:strand:+ start:24005 stop:24910 length:906 start_codon:yes stop_codon:yes gene_type:complete
MQLTILGCHAATPRKNGQTTAQLLEIRGQLILIDCGEGTQMQLRKLGVKFARIQHIFISHLHGDHFYGLIGLISTFRLLGRSADLHIYGPKGIKEIITLQLKLANSWTDYALYFHELDHSEPEQLLDHEKFAVTTLPLKHRVYTNGFLFREKKSPRKINQDAVVTYGIDIADMENLKQGKDIRLADGTLLANALLTLDPEPSKSYAFCSDTAYLPKLADWVYGVNYLYHEATFLDMHQDLAKKTQHSTAAEAAQIAATAKVGQLILGHFSSRYPDRNEFITQAQKHFNNVHLAEDGKRFDW